MNHTTIGGEERKLSTMQHKLTNYRLDRHNMRARAHTHTHMSHTHTNNTRIQYQHDTIHTHTRTYTRAYNIHTHIHASRGNTQQHVRRITW